MASEKVPLKEWLTKLGKRIEAAYPMCKLPDDTARLYREELTDLSDQIGRARTEQAVTNTLRYCKFFPTIAEIRNAIPEPGHRSQFHGFTAEEIAEAEEARKSPEAKQFFALLRKIKAEKRGGNWKQATKESA